MQILDCTQRRSYHRRCVVFAEMMPCDDGIEQLPALDELKGEVVLVLRLWYWLKLSKGVDAENRGSGRTSKKSKILITCGWDKPCRTSVSSCTTEGLLLTSFFCMHLTATSSFLPSGGRVQVACFTADAGDSSGIRTGVYEREVACRPSPNVPSPVKGGEGGEKASGTISCHLELQRTDHLVKVVLLQLRNQQLL